MIAYKYRGGANSAIFDRDLDSIAGDYFYAAGIGKLNDPFEATYNPAPLQSLINAMASLPGDSSAVDDIRSKAQKTFTDISKVGIFSLAKNYDDTKLWAHYANGHTGFCVGYDPNVLERHNGAIHYLLRVKYSKTPPRIDFGDLKAGVIPFLQKVVGTKNPEWAHEQETRIVTDKEGATPHDFRAIKSIYFGLHMSRPQITALMERMKGRGIAYYQMQSDRASYNLVAVPEDDMFPAASPYLYSIAPVTKYALDADPEDEERTALISYLQKAVEIQRRDPYCSEVDYAGASTDKDKAGQVWVNYRYNANYFNRHFTKNQLDDLYAQINDL